MATREEMLNNGNDLLKQRVSTRTLSTESRIDLISRKLKDRKPSSLKLPEYQEVFDDKGISEIVDQISSIITKYEDGIEPHISDVNDDLVRLSAYSTTLSRHVGAIQGYAYHSEQNLKSIHAQVYSDAISLSETSDCKLNGGEAKELAITLTKDQREVAVSVETASKVLFNYMFAVRQFVETLMSVKQSHDRELFRTI